MKLGNPIATALLVSVLLLPASRLYGEGNMARVVTDGDSPEFQSPDKVAAAHAREIRKVEEKTAASEERLAELSATYGLGPILLEDLSREDYSATWRIWTNLKRQLAAAQERHAMATSMTDSELSAAARLYPAWDTHVRSADLVGTAQGLLLQLATELEMVRARKVWIERALGILDDSLELSPEALTEIDMAIREVRVQRAVEQAVKERIQLREQDL